MESLGDHIQKEKSAYKHMLDQEMTPMSPPREGQCVEDILKLDEGEVSFELDIN